MQLFKIDVEWAKDMKLDLRSGIIQNNLKPAAGGNFCGGESGDLELFRVLNGVRTWIGILPNQIGHGLEKEKSTFNIITASTQPLL